MDLRNTIDSPRASSHKSKLDPQNPSVSSPRLSTKRVPMKKTVSEWRPTSGFAVVLYPYRPEKEGHLTMGLGDLVRLEEEFVPANSENPTWYKGSIVLNETQTSNFGLFPCNHCEVKNDSADFVMNDLNQCLREWTEILKKMYADRQMGGFEKLSERVTTLLDWHSKILSHSTPESRKQELREKVSSKIEEGRKMMGLDVIVKTQSGSVATHFNTPMIQLYRMYQETAADAVQDAKSKKKLKKELDTFTSFLDKKETPLVSQKETSLINHLLVDLKIFMCSVGEPTELLFSLYNAATKKFLTEDFLVLLTAQGMAMNMEKIGKLQALFRDLSSRELSNPKLFLVCRVVRRGRMTLDEKKKEKKPTKVEFRRPFGCAVLQLDTIIPKLSTNPIEITMPVYSHNMENDFSILHDLIISKNTTQYSEAPLSKGVCVALSLYNGEIATVLQNHEQLKSITHTDKADFPEVFLPGFERHDIYLTLIEGEFTEKGKSFETSIQLRNQNGTQITDCITLGTGENPISEHSGFTIKGTNHVRWNEKIKLRLTSDQLQNTHLWITNKICSEGKEKSVISNAFLFLCDRTNGTLIDSADKPVPTFKPPKSLADKSYISDPTKLSYRKGETVKVKLSVVSTNDTQNRSMMALLRWNSSPNPDIPKILNDFTYVEQVEIIKFLKNSFNSMFSILDNKTSDQNVALLVYNAIVRIVGVLVDERKTYASFKPVLDTYIQSQFTGALAHKHLMTCLKHYFDTMEKNRSQLMSTLKSLDYILKFIIASRIVFNKTQAKKEDVWFKKDLNGVFTSFNQLMSIDKKEFVGAQSLALKKFSSLFQDLGQVFELSELSELVKNFIEATSTDKQIINMEKLYLVHKLVSSDLFLQDESRQALLPTINSAISKHLNSSSNEEVGESISTILAMLDILNNKITDKRDSLKYLLDLIPVLMNTLNKLKKNVVQTSTTSDALTALLGIFYLLQAEDLQDYFSFDSSDATKIELLTQIGTFFKDLLSSRSYPENWFALILFQMDAVRNILFALGTSLSDHHDILETNEGRKLFTEFSAACFNFVKSPGLALEAFNETKQSMLKETTGDIRIELLSFYKDFWTNLGAYQFYFIAPSVDPLMELMLIPNSQIKNTAFVIYFSLLESEFYQTERLDTVTLRTGTTLERFASEQIASEEFRNSFFVNIQKAIGSADDQLKKLATEFISDAQQTLELSVGFQRIAEGHPDFGILKSIVTRNMMDYMKNTNRIESYLRYVTMLIEHEKILKNYAESGFAALLYINEIPWSDDIMSSYGEYPQETCTARKERLMRFASDSFTKGSCYEEALKLTAALRSRYEDETFEYKKLAQMLQFESEIYTKLTTQERFTDSYFYVGFWGKGFDPEIANKEFIFRGAALERLTDFQTKYQEKYPQATLLSFTEKPNETIQNSPNQNLQIYAVRFSNEEEMKGKKKTIDSNLPGYVKKYLSEFDMDIFVYGKPFKKNKDKPKGPEAEFLDLWVCNTWFKVRNTLPGLGRCSQIIERSEVHVSPIENAINSIKQKNDEIEEMISKYKTLKETNWNPFTMLLKGVIDAAVNGGTKIYNLFQTPQYLKENPQDGTKVKTLSFSLSIQMDLLTQAMELHGKNNPGELHKLFEAQFQAMKEGK